MTLRALPDLDESLGFNLDRVAQLFRRELIRALADYGLTPEQWQILGALAAHPLGVTQADLAGLTFKDKHSTSRMLGRLERAGWIARKPCPEDARATRVVLGRRRSELGAVKLALHGHFARINGLLSVPQQRELLALLRTLRHALDT